MLVLLILLLLLQSLLILQLLLQSLLLILLLLVLILLLLLLPLSFLLLFASVSADSSGRRLQLHRQSGLLLRDCKRQRQRHGMRNAGTKRESTAQERDLAQAPFSTMGSTRAVALAPVALQAKRVNNYDKDFEFKRTRTRMTFGCHLGQECLQGRAIDAR